MFETDLPHWCAFSGAYDCPLRNDEDVYCEESLLKGYCKRKHDEAAEKAIMETKRAVEEAFAEAFCDFAGSNANREFERQMREGWEG